MNQTRNLGRGLALVWAGWWTAFGLGSGIGEGQDWLGVLLHMIVPGLIFLASAIVAWRREAPGGVLLIAEGLLSLFYYPFARTPLGLATLALPPIVAGGLFLWDWRRLHLAH